MAEFSVFVLFENGWKNDQKFELDLTGYGSVNNPSANSRLSFNVTFYEKGYGLSEAKRMVDAT